MKSTSAKNIKSLLKKSQIIFNRWIRLRDQNLGCISCITGRVENAGHFYHGHLYAALRFNEVNCNGQCIHCNLTKAGAAEGYRKGLIRRYGQAKVDLLDSAARQRKTWTIWELELIIKIYSCQE